MYHSWGNKKRSTKWKSVRSNQEVRDEITGDVTPLFQLHVAGFVVCRKKKKNIHIPLLGGRPATDGFNLAASSHSWIKFRVSMIAEYPQRHRRGAKPQHHSRLWSEVKSAARALSNSAVRYPLNFKPWSWRIRLLSLLFWPSFILLIYSHGARLWSVSETGGGSRSHMTGDDDSCDSHIWYL